MATRTRVDTDEIMFIICDVLVTRSTAPELLTSNLRTKVRTKPRILSELKRLCVRWIRGRAGF